MKTIATLHLAACLSLSHAAFAGDDHVVYEPKPGPGGGKHVVLVSGDEEYRSEEALPMLGKILSQRHGFKCTVLFSLGADGTIDPAAGGSIGHPEALDSADALVVLTRFRSWNEAALAKFDAAMKRGVPVIGLRTATHAFNGIPKDSPYAKWNFNNQGGWGRAVLGETWVSHWGKHKVEACLGVVEPSAKDHPILRGVGQIFANSDVYEAAPPEDAKILVRGQVLTGMTPDTPAATYKKKNRAGVEQPVNEPMMPVVWTREVKNDAGTTNKVVCSTMGAATDLECEGTRRLVVNAVFWGLGLDVPQQADVGYVDPFTATMYGFKGFKPGVKPADLVIQAK